MNQKISVINPRTGQADYTIKPWNAREIEQQAARMRKAQIGWKDLGLEGRGEALVKFADTLEVEKDKVISALSIDTGRARIAHQEVLGVIGAIRGWTHFAPSLMPETGWVQGRMKPNFKHQNGWEPYSLVGVISPWNFPMTLSFIDSVPALMAGACVMIKPSEVTPRFADSLKPIIESAGLPEILCFVQGDGKTGAALINHVDCICFTGSVPTGRKVALACAENLITCNLELGGKDPMIITENADMDKAAQLALRASVLATGQACQSIERIYVPETQYDAFTSKLAELADETRLNFPDINSGQIGPFIFSKQAGIVQAQIDDAVTMGAKLLSGGKIERHGGGYWLRPTVLGDVNHDMAVMRKETFGPVMPVMAYDTIDRAIELANDTEYGLSAAVFAGSIDEARMIAERIDAGAISLMDGALTGQYFEAGKQSFKNSGLGASRMGAAGFLRFFRQKAYIANMVDPLWLDDFAEGS